MSYKLTVIINRNNDVICIKDKHRKTFIKTSDVDTSINEYLYKNHSKDLDGYIKFTYIKQAE